MGEIILISDKRVKAITCHDNAEPIVDLCIDYPELTVDLERYLVQKQSKSISLVRRQVAEMLVHAQDLLPDGIRLLIKECHRPMWVQKNFWEGYFGFLQKKYPQWTDEQVYKECSKLSAPLDVAPHTTGGAVDLTLITEKGQWLDMGTEINALPIETSDATFTFASNISDEAKAHRQILIDVMSEAGFVNYPTEWWHWSYGDKYWALLAGQPYAIYDSLL